MPKNEKALSDEEMKTITDVFYEELEKGGPDVTKEILDAKIRLREAEDDYSSATDFYYFAWGYKVGLEKGRKEKENVEILDF